MRPQKNAGLRACPKNASLRALRRFQPFESVPASSCRALTQTGSAENADAEPVSTPSLRLIESVTAVDPTPADKALPADTRVCDRVLNTAMQRKSACSSDSTVLMELRASRMFRAAPKSPPEKKPARENLAGSQGGSWMKRGN